MNIWILYRHAEAHLQPEAYEMRRLLDVGRSRGHDIQVRRPEDFELLVTSDSEPSIMINHDIVPLPDVMLPRMGVGTNYFCSFRHKAVGTFAGTNLQLCTIY